MRWFPWISREHHEAVIRAKDETIRLLEERLKQPVQVTVEMARRVAPAKRAEETSQDSTPVEETQPRLKRPREWREIDFSTLDERDPVQMAALAAEEFGGRIPPPMILARWYQQVRMQCVHERRRRAAQSAQTGNVGTIVLDTPQSVEVPEKKDVIEVPKSILELIETAERGS